MQLKRALLERLPRYYHILREMMEREGAASVSSAQIADRLGIDDTQVRKDLAAIGVRGFPRVGFPAAETAETICGMLGFDGTWRAVIVGAGRLGGALAAYPGFSRYGLEVVALLDTDPNRIGASVESLPVLPLEALEGTIERHEVRLGILTVPADVAEATALRMSSAGIRAIWNFTPSRFSVPDGVVVRHEDLSDGLAELTFHLRHRPA